MLAEDNGEQGLVPPLAESGMGIGGMSNSTESMSSMPTVIPSGVSSTAGGATTQETPIKPKRAASWVRKYYKTVDNQQVCLICQKTYGITTSTATTGRHLIRCHLNMLQEVDWSSVGRQKTLEVELARMPGGAARILDSGSVDEAFMDWIEETAQPYTAVDCPFFKRLFLKLGYTLPDVPSLTAMIEERRRRMTTEPLNLNNLNDIVEVPRDETETLL